MSNYNNNISAWSEKEIIEYVTGGAPDFFLARLGQKWEELLDGLGCEWANARQLRIGNRLRPQLVFWGYLLAQPEETLSYQNEALVAAVGFELIHKASIILDDLLDYDDFRHGEPSFHKEFSEKAAALFPYKMIYIAQRQAEESGLPKGARLAQLLRDTANDLNDGAIREHERLTHDRVQVDYIIEKETIPLIQNALTCAAELEGGSTERIQKLRRMLAAVGYSSAFIFQIMNDMEPFFGSDLIRAHKGIVHFDVDKNKKNYLYSWLLELVSTEEAKRLNASEGLDTEYLLELVQRYDMKERMLGIVGEKYENVTRAIGEYEQLYGNNIVSAFRSYSAWLHQACLKRANIKA